MAKSKKKGEELHVSTVLAATFRASIAFFAHKDLAIEEYHPNPFPHWMRGDNHFNLIATNQRRAIRFEANRFIVRVEGHPNRDVFEETVAIAKKLVADFHIKQVFEMNFTSIRSYAMPTAEEAQEHLLRSSS